MKKVIWVIVLLAIGCASFFWAAPKAQNPESYEKTIATLDSLENKAMIMTASSTALATAAAMVPGDVTNPIANKLADVAGYMVIVYVAIIMEKYLLAMSGLAAFKIMIPIALAAIGISIFVNGEKGKVTLHRLACKLALLGILLWALVPTSALVTNIINDTYDMSYGVETELEEGVLESIDEIEAEEKAAEKSGEEEKGNFSIKNLWSNIVDKTSNVTETVKGKVSDGVVEFQNSMNKMIEGVAVMIVTTCVIPLCVLILFLWIVKNVTGLNITVPSLKKLPKASRLLKKPDEKTDAEVQEICSHF